MKTKCHHSPHTDSLTTVGLFRSILAEGCPHPECEVIRVYNLKSGEISIAYENTQPRLMCAGPPDTMLVCEKKRNQLVHLQDNGGDF